MTFAACSLNDERYVAPGCNMSIDLDSFFKPRSVAVLGAGERATSSGGAVLKSLKKANFNGQVIPVNPKGGEVFGLKVAKSLHELDQPADLAVIVIRSEKIPDAVRAAAETGHKNIMILPGGFSEAGAEGAAREQEIREIADQAGITVVGPNCAGIISLADGHRFAATFLSDLPSGGGAAFISQSGALAGEVIAKSRRMHIPLGTVVTVGNAMHLPIEAYLEYLGHDDDVNSVLLYLESVRDLDRLVKNAAEISRDKPVVALMPGRTEEARRATRAHTGMAALPVDETDRICREAGILRVRSLRELLLAAKGFGQFPAGFGPRTLFLSNSGGPGVLATDCGITEGLSLPDPPPELARALSEILPGEASLNNPLDIVADAREDRFAETFDLTLRHGADSYDSILVIHVSPVMVDMAAIVEALAERIENCHLPVMYSMMGTLKDGAAWFDRLEAAGCPTFDNAEDMAMTAALMARYHAIKNAHAT